MRKTKNTAALSDEAAHVATDATVSEEAQLPTASEAAPLCEETAPQPGTLAQDVAGWAGMTTGIEDYACWQQMFAGRTGEGDPPFRRGRIWA